MPLVMARSPVVLPGAYDPLRSLPVVYLDAARSASTLAAGMAAQFTAATSEHLVTTSSAALQTGDIDFAWEFWFYLDSVDAIRVIMGKEGTGGDELDLRVSAANKLVWSVYNGAWTAVTADTFGALSVSTWYQGLVWHDATNDQLGVAVNNVADTAAYSGGVTAGTAGLYFGRAGDAGVNYFNGRMGPARFWKRVPSADERTTLYNSGVPLSYAQSAAAGLHASLIECWELNEPSGARVGLHAGISLTDTNTVTTAAGICLNAVEQWNDLSGNGNHATQATQANKPVYRVGIVNGRPVVRGDGVDDILSLANTASLNITGTGLTILAVVSRSDASKYMVPVTRRSVADLQYQFTWVSNAGAEVPNQNKLRLNLRLGGATASFNSDSAHTQTTSFHVLATRYDGVNVAFWFDGAADGTTAETRAIETLAVGGATLGDNNTDYSAGDVAEVIVIARAVPDSELAKLIRDMGRRAGIAIA